MTLPAVYTSDAIAFPPDGEMIRGNEAIGAFWKATRESGVQSVSLTTVDVGSSGDLAHEAGTVVLDIAPAGKDRTTAVAKYVVVWKWPPARARSHPRSKCTRISRRAAHLGQRARSFEKGGSVRTSTGSASMAVVYAPNRVAAIATAVGRNLGT